MKLTACPMRILVATLLLSLLPPATARPPANRILDVHYADPELGGARRLILRRHALKLLPLGRDEVIAAAVADSNRQPQSRADILALDQRWRQGAALNTLVNRLLTNDCAERLRLLTPPGSGYDEAFVMDASGALVCMTNRTSDYWQGDEPKWQLPFRQGLVLVGRLDYDASADRHLVQISVPVRDAQGRRIGAITVGKTVAPP